MRIFYTFQVLIAIAGFLLFFSPLKAQSFEEVDAYAIATLNYKARNVETLAEHLCKPWPSDILKVRAIYRWITENIAYSVAATNYSAQHVLDSRYAVCEGYMDLFRELCEAAGIQVRGVMGYAKIGGDEVGLDLNPPYHAWNIVYIEGAPYFVDVTWASGYGADNGLFVKKLDDIWFLTDPSFFIYSHFPGENERQLLPVPLTETQFVNLPYIHSQAIHNQMTHFLPAEGIIPVTDSIRISFESLLNLKVFVDVVQNSQAVEKYYNQGVIRQGDQYTVTLPKPKAGNYVLQLGTKMAEDITGSYNICAEWKLVVK